MSRASIVQLFACGLFDAHRRQSVTTNAYGNGIDSSVTLLCIRSHTQHDDVGTITAKDVHKFRYFVFFYCFIINMKWHFFCKRVSKNQHQNMRIDGISFVVGIFFCVHSLSKKCHLEFVRFFFRSFRFRLSSNGTCFRKLASSLFFVIKPFSSNWLYCKMFSQFHIDLTSKMHTDIHFSFFSHFFFALFSSNFSHNVSGFTFNGTKRKKKE